MDAIWCLLNSTGFTTITRPDHSQCPFILYRQAVSNGKGRVHLTMIPREGAVDALVALVTEQCDLRRPSGGEKPVINVTGIGANFFNRI